MAIANKRCVGGGESEKTVVIENEGGEELFFILFPTAMFASFIIPNTLNLCGVLLFSFIHSSP